MSEITANNAARQHFMLLMRELVRAYQAFAALDARLHREAGSGLTVSQADVVFTLGNTPGMTCGEIGERTLITKGTLTGVIDRLVRKGLVARTRGQQDARCVHVTLTAQGKALFERAFPRHVAALKQRFDQMDSARQDQAIALLAEIRAVLD